MCELDTSLEHSSRGVKSCQACQDSSFPLEKPMTVLSPLGGARPTRPLRYIILQ